MISFPTFAFANNTGSMKESAEQSLWELLEGITAHLKHKRLADVFRIVSFRPSETFGPHEHLRLEINYVKKGRCLLHLENECVGFGENEMMIINSNVSHTFEAGPEGATLIQLEFLPEIFAYFESGHPHRNERTPVLLFPKEHRLIKIVNNVQIMRAVQCIINELNTKGKYHRYLVIMSYAELLILICRYMDDVYVPTCTNEPLKRAIAYIRLNYPSEMTVTKVAAHAGVSERYLRMLFVQHVGETPVEYMNQVRINKSIELLQNTEMSIKEICFACGFRTPQYFSRIFKRQTGITPNQMMR